MQLIIDTRSGRVLGSTNDNGYHREGAVLLAMPEGFEIALAEDWVWDGTNLVHDPLAAVNRLKASRISQIKADAATRIEAMSWRVERAQERELLGVVGEKVGEVLLEREVIRRASSRTEAEVNAAPDVASVNAVVFAITSADYATPERISRVEFLNRFTDGEMQAFVSASKTTPALETYLLKLESAEGVILTDPVTMAGVQALEMLGLIAQGRAASILEV